MSERVCVCGVPESEHALCGCGDGFEPKLAKHYSEENDTPYPYSYWCQGCEHEWSSDVKDEDECPKCQSIGRVVAK